LLSGVYAFYPRDNEKQLVVKKEGAAEVTKPGEGTKGRGEEVSSLKSEVEGKSEVSSLKSEVGSKTKVSSNAPVAASNEQIVSNSLTEATAFSEMPVASDTVNFKPQTSDSKLVASEAEETIKTEQAVISPLLQTAPLVTSLEPEETEERKKKKSRENNLWLALGAAAGNYAPNTPNSKAPTSDRFSFAGVGPAAVANDTKPEPKIGTSYSVGMAVGKKFGRVVIQTGVNLNKQQIEYTSNYDTRTTSNVAKASSMDYLDVSAESAFSNSGTPPTSNVLSLTNTYTVNSTMEVVSIPVQAGYMIVDRKLGWQINAGVSPDFFLRNILVDKSGQRERFTQGAGSESPYRSLNWTGLMNTELSYRIGDHYRLSIVPGVRYSFNSILKDPTDNGKPVILDVGFRFKYLFD
jgi:hypothetical protein